MKDFDELVRLSKKYGKLTILDSFKRMEALETEVEKLKEKLIHTQEALNDVVERHTVGR